MTLKRFVHSSRRLTVGLSLAAALGITAACGLGGMTPTVEAQAAPAPAPAPRAADDLQPPVQGPVPAVPKPRQTAAGLRTSFSDVLQPAMEAVVSVTTESHSRQREREMPWPFGEGPGRNDDDTSFGSGVVVRADGIILTNNHVVADAERVTVRFADNRELQARVLGSDPATDIAVLQVEAKDLPTMPLGRSGDLHVGDVVFAIGSPYTLAQTATMGIISATSRSNVGVTRGGYEDFIQTDASINPGNSGGALVDSNGELIGINTAIYSQGSRGNQGIGFAVPVDMARRVMDQIVSRGRVVRSQLGVNIKGVDAALARSYGLTKPVGAVVTRVEPGSPAHAAGLREEDVILEVDGRAIADDSALRLDISSRTPGSRVELAVLRDEDGNLSKRTLGATLRELELDEDDEEAAAPPRRAPADDGLRLTANALRGIDVVDVAELPGAARRQLGIKATSGVVIEAVSEGTPAARAGLRPGDVITAVDGHDVADSADFARLARERGLDVVRLRFQRGGYSDIRALAP